jgi:hypothetical protein
MIFGTMRTKMVSEENTDFYANLKCSMVARVSYLENKIKDFSQEISDLKKLLSEIENV